MVGVLPIPVSFLGCGVHSLIGGQSTIDDNDDSIRNATVSFLQSPTSEAASAVHRIRGETAMIVARPTIAPSDGYINRRSERSEAQNQSRS